MTHIKKVLYDHVLYVIVFLIGCRGQFMILSQLGVLYRHLSVVYSKNINDNISITEGDVMEDNFNCFGRLFNVLARKLQRLN